MAKTKKKVMLYAVLRLNEAIEVENVYGEPCFINVKKEDIAGYIPVYTTEKAAKEHSQDGKYSIVAIETSDKQQQSK